MFDGVDVPRQPPRPRPVNENAVTILIVVFALLLLVTPFSLGGMVDIIRYVRGH